MFSNLKIKTKLLTMAAVLLVFLLFIGSLSVYFMNRLNSSLSSLSTVWIPGIVLADDINYQANLFRSLEYRHIAVSNQKDRKAAEAEMKECIEAIEADIEGYLPLAETEEDLKLINEVKSSWESYLSHHNTILALSKSSQTVKAIEVMLGDAKASYDAVTESCKNIVNLNQDGSIKLAADGVAIYKISAIIIFVCLVVNIIAAVLLSLRIVVSVTRPVRELQAVADQMAEGKLNVTIKYRSADELGSLADSMRTMTKRISYYMGVIISDLECMSKGDFNITEKDDFSGDFRSVQISMLQTIASLNSALTQINQSADQVSSGSGQVSAGAQSLSLGTSEQASAVEELSSTVNEISGEIGEASSNAAAARSLAVAAGQEIEECSRQMNELIASMQEIAKSSGEIGRIIKTIEDIAFQTNILALNASIEAARAGVSGRGFAVVASEVRNLAGQSSEASMNTSALIENAERAVDRGMVLVDVTARSLGKVVDTAQAVTSSVDRISEAAKAQKLSIDQVVQGLDQISSVVQSNSATADESAAASEQLAGQAQFLKELVARFELKETVDRANNS